MGDDRIAFNGRPSSTIVQNFADDLDAMFGLDKLSQTVEAKKQTVSSVEQELQQLEARLKEAEQRLARVSRTSSPSRAAPPRPPPPVPTGLNAPEPMAAVPRSSPLSQRPTYPADRPPTQAGPGEHAPSNTHHAMPTHLPPEPPSGGNSDYVMVDRNPQQQMA